MTMQLQCLAGIVFAAFGLLACFLPSCRRLGGGPFALNSLAGGPIDRAMQSGRGEKSVSLIFSLLTAERIIYSTKNARHGVGSEIGPRPAPGGEMGQPATINVAIV